MAKGKFEEPRMEPVMTEERPRRMPLALWIIPVLLAVVVLAVVLFGAKLKNGETIYPNVRVAGVDVGGMKPAEAQQLVEQTMQKVYQDQPLEVILPDRTLRFEPEQTKVKINAEKAIGEAMDYGRKGGLLQTIIRYLVSVKTIYTINLDTALIMDTDYLKSVIHQVADEVRVEPVNAAVSLDADMTMLTITVGSYGCSLNEEGLYYEVYDAFQRGDLAPISWDYEAVAYKKVKATEICEKLESMAVDAYYDEENRQIVPSVNGYTFDVEQVLRENQKTKKGQRIEIPLEVLEPEITTGKLTYEMFGEVLEQRSSVYVNNPKRTENLRLACEAINGTILNPGDVFSFNEIVGERTEEKGYQPATIYGGEGESVDGVGGGVCQVASTIYYAALYMDLPTLMREPHMYEVTYVPAGCDATIFWESGLDYKFRNNRENPIKIQANIDGGKVNITFWGVKESENYVELSKPVTLETWTDEDVEEVDVTKPVGYREQKQTAYTGSKVVVTKKVFDGDGKLLREEKLESTYKSRPNIYIVGPSEEQPPAEKLPGEQNTTENTETTETTEQGE